MIAFNAVSLVDEVMKSDLDDKVKEIVADATADTHQTGETLWATLVYSGVALGVEQSQEYFHQSVTGMVSLLRIVVARLDATIGKTDDFETLQSLTEVNDQIREILAHRAGILTDMVATAAEERYGVKREHLLGSDDPDGLPDEEVEAIGAIASHRQPLYFYLWHKLDEIGKLKGMKCACQACLMEAYGKTNLGPLDPAATLRALAKTGISRTLRTYGRFIVSNTRESLFDLLEGGSITNHSGKTKVDAEQIVKKMMKGFVNRS